MRTPDWSEVRAFLNHDRWEHDARRSTDHDYFEKTLSTGETLITRVSRAYDKTISPGRFKAILSDQLRVSESQFWDVIRSGRPVDRPSREAELAPPSIPLWLVVQLERAGVRSAELEGLDEEAALALLHERWSRPAT